MTPDTSLPNLGAEPLYFYADANNEPVGPLPLQKLLHLYNFGMISADTHVIGAGGSEWQPFASVAREAQPVLPPPLPPMSGSVPFRQPAHTLPEQLQKPNLDRFAENVATGFVKASKVMRFSFGCLVAALFGVAILGLVVVAGVFGLTHFLEARRPASIPPQAQTTPAAQPTRSEHAMGAEKATKDQTRPAVAAPPQATPKPTPTPPKRLAQFETFRLGNFTYQIKDAVTTKHLGAGGWATAEAGAESTFVVVLFSIKSESKSVEVVHSNDLRLRTAAGREFGFHDGAVLALTQGKDAMFRELQPGIPKDAATAFEVPLAALSGEFILTVPEKGFFGSGRVEVVIKPKSAAASPTVAAQATPAPKQFTGRALVETLVRECFGSELTTVEVTELLGNDGLKSGRLNAKVRFNIGVGWSAKTNKLKIETKMRDAYEKLFSRAPMLNEVTLFADAPMIDRVGEENVDLVYKTNMTKLVASKINWQNKDALDFTGLWNTQQIHPSLRQQ